MDLNTNTGSNLTLSPTLARRLAITRQRLAGPRPQPDAAGILEIVRALGCLQLDPISAVARSHLLVLWSRLGQYDPAHLGTLLWQERQLFEYWAHAASIVLTDDFPFHQARMRQWPDGNTAWSQRVRAWLAKNESFRQYILQRLDQQGPLQASQFEDKTVTEWESGGWTSNQNIRQMLNFLWMQGQITVAMRSGQARQWDLIERCLPDGIADRTLTEPDVVYHAAQRSLRALGVARPEHIKNHFIRDRYPNLTDVLGLLENERRIVQVEVCDKGQEHTWPGPWYVHVDDLPLLDQLATDAGAWAPQTTLLSPFDNLICDRTRTEMLFDFKYRTEIYVPKAKRQYGYYVMPVLHGDRLIGRIDPKMDRRQTRLMINAVYLEPDAPTSQEVALAVVGAINELALFLGAQEVVYDEPVPKAWRNVMKTAHTA